MLVNQVGDLPVRYNWAAEYRCNAMVVYGHTSVPEPDWLNKTINTDTGCVFGGSLTAPCYSEQEFVSVKTRKTYCEPARPFLADDQKSPALSTQHEHDDPLDLADVTGKRIISTRLRHNVTVREENGTAALGVMSRFAANPKWLVYLPPTFFATNPSAIRSLASTVEFRRHHNTPMQPPRVHQKRLIVVCPGPRCGP